MKRIFRYAVYTAVSGIIIKLLLPYAMGRTRSFILTFVLNRVLLKIKNSFPPELVKEASLMTGSGRQESASDKADFSPTGPKVSRILDNLADNPNQRIRDTAKIIGNIAKNPEGALKDFSQKHPDAGRLFQNMLRAAKDKNTRVGGNL